MAGFCCFLIHHLWIEEISVEKPKRVDLSEITEFVGQKFGTGVSTTIENGKSVFRNHIDKDEFVFYLGRNDSCIQ